VLIRTNAPVFGAADTLPQREKEWQVSFSYRGLTSDDHYNGVKFQYARKANETYVINTQQLYDLSATYYFTNRWSASLSVPVVNSTWALPTPIAPLPPGPRAEQNSSGLGDIIVSGRLWMLDPEKHPRGNWSLGLGVKAPTGKNNVEDSYPNINGTNDREKVVDMSIQPGDGGWGYLFDLQGYKALKRVTFFGSGTYLASPKNTTGEPSIVVGLGVASPANVRIQENSAVDNYLLRAGAVFPVKESGFAMSLAFRMEGLPRYDLIGDNLGFRRPGYETFIEPGFIYNLGRQTLSLYVPIGLVQNRLKNPSDTGGQAGDATFPEYIILAGYSYRFPARGAGSPQEQPIDRAPQQPVPPTTGGPGTSAGAR